MAKPIAPTPVLEGEDAKKFFEQLEKDDSTPNPQKAAFLKECREVYKRLSSA